MKLIFIFLLALIASSVTGITVWSSVSEGNVGIFYHFGSLLNQTFPPGLYFKAPWPFTSGSQVNIRPQTDQIQKVSCGTSDGLNLLFEQVDVGNTLTNDYVLSTIRKYGEEYDEYLVKDKVRHQIQVICSGMVSHEVFITRFDEIDDMLKDFLTKVNKELDSGLIIDFVRLSKPVLPEGIKKNYERLAEEKTNLKVEIERQERLKKEAETQKMMEEKNQQLRQYKSQMESQIEFEKSSKENEIKLAKKVAEEEQSTIENRIRLEKEKIEALTLKIKMEEEAKGIKQLYELQGYREYQIVKELARSIEKGSKYFFGNQIPNFLPSMFIQNTESN